MASSWGTWVAQSVERPTLDLGSGGDLRVRGFEPHMGVCADGTKPAWILSLLLSAPPLFVRSLSLSLSKKKKKNRVASS